MKRIFICIAALLFAANVNAQNEIVFDTTNLQMLEEVVVSGVKVQKNAPFAVTEIKKTELEEFSNTGKELPFLFSKTPGIISWSDNGVGTGTSYMRIRGAGDSRINVTLDGVPLNSPEDQCVFWANMNSYGSLLGNVQIQRGVGSSTNGDGAFGGTITLMSASPSTRPSAEVTGSYGSFNTLNFGANVSTGLLWNHLIIDGAYHETSTDGFLDGTSAVPPQHLHLALDGVGVAVELLLDAFAAEAVPDEVPVALDDGLGIGQAVQPLLDGALGGQLPLGSGALAHLAVGLGVAGEPGVVRGRAHGGAPDGDTGLAEALHGRQGDEEAGLLRAVGGTAGRALAAPDAAGQSHTLAGPFLGQGADAPGGDAGLLGGPLAGLGNAVLLAHDIVPELLDADGLPFHVIMVVGVVLEPGVGDGRSQGGVGAGPGGEPGAVHHGVGGVVEGVDEDALHAHLLQPDAPDVAFLAGVDAMGAVRVIGPEDHHIGVLQGVLQEVELLRLAQTPVEAPHMGGAPHPAFP